MTRRKNERLKNFRPKMRTTIIDVKRMPPSIPGGQIELVFLLTSHRFYFVEATNHLSKYLRFSSRYTKSGWEAFSRSFYKHFCQKDIIFASSFSITSKVKGKVIILQQFVSRWCKKKLTGKRGKCCSCSCCCCSWGGGDHFPFLCFAKVVFSEVCSRVAKYFFKWKKSKWGAF